ncbi:unnamed protein product [Sympodiomycopsis kandeliae]
MASSSTDIASIEAQLALSRASLADKIFARYGQSTGSSGTTSQSGKGKAAENGTKAAKTGKGNTNGAFQHRPPTLGLGAQPQGNGNGNEQIVGKMSLADARLKGRLTNKKAELAAAQQQQQQSNSKRKADQDASDDEDADESESRATLAKTSKKKNAKVDPFAPKPSKGAKQAPPSQPAEVEQTPNRESNSPQKNGANAGDEYGKLSKSQRKKLNKKRKLEAESAGSHMEGAVSTSEPSTQDQSISATASTPGPSTSQASSYQPSAALPDMDTGAASGSGLSEHQQALRAKLQGSQFRQLNESLYTSESADSFRLAQEDPTRMQAYHEGFREQTKKWPQKPFELIGDIIADAVEGSWNRLVSGKKGKTDDASDDDVHIPPGAVVADLGAGEGPLAKYLSTHGKLSSSKAIIPPSLRPKVFAYDLLDTADGIVRGVDCARAGGVPLPGPVGYGSGVQVRSFLSRSQNQNKGKQSIKANDKSSGTSSSSVAAADVAVFCLSLMGTDWVNMILEARRILRNGGSLIIAEVTSRLTSIDEFVDLIEHLGFKLDNNAKDTNTHFILFKFHKWTHAEVVKQSKKKDDDVEVMSLEDARQADQIAEEKAMQAGKEVLKPCLYKRR